MTGLRVAVSLACSGLLLLAGCAAAGPAPQSGDLLIRNARLLDPAGEAPVVVEGAAVLIRDGKIAAVGNASSTFAAAQTVDAGGQTLLPGLTDMHVHLWDEAELAAYLSYGVTSVRNMSGMPFHLELADRVEAGELAGPHLITTGPILNSPGANQQVNHQIVTTAEEAREAVAWQAGAGFTRLKVYSNLNRESYEAVLDAAAEHGLAITGHTPEGLRSPGIPLTRPFNIGFDEVLDDGFETIEHVESIVWHGLRDRHDADAARALARKIAAAGAPVTATRVAHRNLYRMAETDGAAADRPETALLNPFVQAMEAGTLAYWAGQPAGRLAQNDAFQAQVTGIFNEEGVVLVAGSDAGIFMNAPGVSLHEELALMVEAGLTPYEALRSATAAPARVLGEEGRLGCVQEGCEADLILSACDPLADIACTRELTGLVRAGRWYPPAAIEALREQALQHDVARTQANLFAGLEAQGTPLPAIPGD